MKRQNNKKHGKKTLIVLSLLALAFVAALFLGAVKIYAIFQEKELQEKVSVLIDKEETYHAENTEKQSKMIGSHYVESFYPLLDGQVMASVKEQMDADSQTIKDNQKKGDKIEELTFYYAEEKETISVQTTALSLWISSFRIQMQLRKSSSTKYPAS